MGKGAEKAEGTKGKAPDVDALYKLPLTEFTASRNALAGRLKKSGRAEEAERVKALNKPSAPAWAVNQLFWRHRDRFDRLIAAGDRLRQAQASKLAGRSTSFARHSRSSRARRPTSCVNRAAPRRRS